MYSHPPRIRGTIPTQSQNKPTSTTSHARSQALTFSSMNCHSYQRDNAKLHGAGARVWSAEQNRCNLPGSCWSVKLELQHDSRGSCGLVLRKRRGREAEAERTFPALQLTERRPSVQFTNVGETHSSASAFLIRSRRGLTTP